MPKADWKAYLAFSKKDRIAAIVLLILITVFFIAPFFYHPFSSQPIVTVSTLDQELVKQEADSMSDAEEPVAYFPSDNKEITNSLANALFQFDPNTLDATGFKRLGLQDRTIKTIVKYRSKGGHFWKPEDLRKIYGLQKEEADRLMPFVQIAKQPSTAKTEKQQINNSTPTIIDINTATSEEWKTLPLIGDVLANRIVKFRDKIGGFKTLAQVKQTYGLSDSAFQVIVPYLKIASVPQKMDAPASQNDAIAEKTNINTANLNQLKSNPHIPGEIAQAIIIYRSQHGNFSSIADIKKIVFINEEKYKQLAPFITVE